MILDSGALFVSDSFIYLFLSLQSESSDGRLWILQQAAFDDALPILGLLTVDTHQWAASNSALVLARLVTALLLSREQPIIINYVIF